MKQSALTEIARKRQRTKHIKIESAPQVNTSRIESASTEHPASVAPALSTLRAGRHFLIRQTWRMQRENDGRNV